MILIELIRDNLPTSKHNFGKMYAAGKLLGETLEDTDRYMEEGGKKIDGDTAIPRGRYKLTVTFSQRFQQDMPYLHNVPGFEGVRIHGGNTEADTHGCPLLGSIRTDTGIAQCAVPNKRLMNVLEDAEDRGDEVWIDVL
jgi:hypothetical protein